MKIAVLGNSVPLRVRPEVSRQSDAAYGRLLANHFPSASIEINAKGADTISEALVNVDNYISMQASYYILNFGVVESCTRSSNRTIYNWLNTRNPSGYFKTLCKGIESKLRPTLVKLRGKRSWMSAEDFVKALDEISLSISKDVYTKFIVLGINDCSKRVENQLPGSSENIKRFNALIKEYSSKKLNLTFIDPNEFKVKLVTPDGIHYNAKDHKQIAEELAAIIKEWEE